MPEFFIGLMSGTSLDGIDAVLADCAGGRAKLVAACHHSFAPQLRAELLSLQAPGADELHRAAVCANQLAHTYAESVAQVLRTANLGRAEVHAVGCHGQTIRHQPQTGYTLQLVNGALLAELTAIDVICDFRSRDIAAGGQGAPLVPAFHRAQFGSAQVHRVIVNLGGIANITDLPPRGPVKGFDCGPGNVLMDSWTARHEGRSYDAEGAWATSGNVLSELLDRLLDHEFFALSPPKSTGRDLFNSAWLDSQLGGSEPPADVQATLLALTVRSIAEAIKRYCGQPQEIYLCGGGTRNAKLRCELETRVAPARVAATDALGVAAEHVEALAFAWLAQRTLARETGSLASVTGALGDRVLGAIYRV